MTPENYNNSEGACQLERYDRDREYWNEYYKGRIKQELIPSDFARVIAEMLDPGVHILELGCGNGRDSCHFLEKGYRVTAVDASNFAIDLLQKVASENDRANFICHDFVKGRELYSDKYDCVYSRFTLHAITSGQEDELLRNVKNALSENGLFCIEARTIHDDIYGCGENVGHNEFIYNGHFRRFIDVEEFGGKLKNLGFEIVSLEENTGFSKTAESDPVLMRCVARV